MQILSSIWAIRNPSLAPLRRSPREVTFTLNNGDGIAENERPEHRRRNRDDHVPVGERQRLSLTGSTRRQK